MLIRNFDLLSVCGRFFDIALRCRQFAAVPCGGLHSAELVQFRPPVTNRFGNCVSAKCN